MAGNIAQRIDTIFHNTNSTYEDPKMWIIFLSCVACLAGSIDASKKLLILNGQDAIIEDFPYQASFRHKNRHFCGASIIGEKHVLTAAHCIYYYIVPPHRWQTIVTGSSQISEGGKFHKISNITVHPNYQFDGNRGINDIAVITLKDKIVFDEYQQKINLPKHNFQAGEKANLTGWGRTHQQRPVIRPDQLQLLETKLISLDECQNRVINPQKTKIYDTEVCTDNSEGTGMCLGDSGGPLAVNGELVGLVGWTDGDYCGGGHPDVYANVYKYKDFIESVVKETV